MENINTWVEYYNHKAARSDDPLEISDMHLGNDVANKLFWESEEYRMRALLQPLNVRGIRHLLDLGCSAGTCTGLMEKHFDVVTGVDLAEKTIEVARRRLPHCTFIVDDITQLTTLETQGDFTHVVSYGVIHYLSEDGITDFFSALARVTRTGTRIAICRVPNKDYYNEYQAFRLQRNINRNRIVRDQLQWTWLDEDFIRERVQEHFEFIPFMPLLQLEFPLKAFFDFVLIRK